MKKKGFTVWFAREKAARVESDIKCSFDSSHTLIMFFVKGGRIYVGHITTGD